MTRRARVLAVAALLAALGVLSLVRRFGPTWKDDGAIWSESANGLVVSAIVRDSPAEEFGLHVGDTLVALDSHRITTRAELRSELTRAGVDTTYLVLRGGREVSVHLTPLVLPAGDKRLFVYLSLMGFFCLALGTLVALRRPGERLRLHFAALCALFFVVYSVSDSGRLDALDWGLLLLDAIGIALLPPVFFHFCLKLVKTASTGSGLAPSTSPSRKTLIYGAACSWAVLQLAGIFASARPAFEALLGFTDRFAPLYLSAFFVAGALVLWRASARVRAGAERRRVRSLAIGTAVGIAPFLSFYALPFALGRSGGILPELFGFIPLAFLPLSLAYAVIQNRIVDIGLLFRRMIVTVLAAAAIFGICLLVLSLAGAGDRSDTIPILIVMALVALLFFPLRDRVQQAIDRLALRDRYESRQALVRLSSDLSTELDRGRLAERLLEGVAKALPISRGALFVRDSGRLQLLRHFGSGAPPSVDGDLSLQRAADPARSGAPVSSEDSGSGRFAHYFPCVARGETVAVLSLGDPSTEEPIDFEESDLVRSVCAVTATALLNGRLFASLDEKANELARLKDYHASIVESLEAGVIVLNPEGRIERFNRAMEELVGVKREQAIGATLEEALSKPAAQALGPVLKSARDSERGQSLYKMSLPLHGQAAVTVNVNAAPFERGSEDASGTILLFHDVTDRVALERQVQQTEKMVAVGVLAAGVAHEVNTPLTGISSYTQLLKQQMDPKDPRFELLDKIEKQTVRGAKIVSHLLNFSRSGGADTEMLDMSHVAESVLGLLEHQLEKSRVRVVRELGSVPTIVGNENKMQQVLFNLILNARDAMPRGGWLTLRTKVDRGDVVLEVADTGHGIPEADLPRIFDPFFTTKDVGRGTGLGLAVTYGIVQEHQGTIRATSIPGQGARFEVRIPAATIAVEARA